jgi:hypothetical protein
MHVLDIATSTGLSAEAALDAVGPTGHVTAADISPAMIEKERQRRDQAPNASVSVEDGQALSFSRDSVKKPRIRKLKITLKVQSSLITHPVLARQKSVDGQIDPAGWGGAPANDAVQNDPEGTFAGGVTSRALEYKRFPFASIGTSLPWLLPSPKST